MSLERTIVDQPSKDGFAVLMQLAGQCLVRYQRIERALKIMLPHFDKPDTRPSEDRNWREFLDGKHTLGLLMERFKGVVQSDHLESAYAHLERIVGERNDLVHHFFVSSRRVLGTPEALEEGIAELRLRLDHSRSLEEALVSMMKEYAEDLERFRDAEDGEACKRAP